MGDKPHHNKSSEYIQEITFRHFFSNVSDLQNLKTLSVVQV